MDLLDDASLLDLRRRAKATDPAAVLAEERARRDALGTRSNELSGSMGDASTTTSTQGAVPMSGPSPCAICTTRPARDQCTNCGRPTCAADLWVMLRLCRACASQRDVERGQRGARPEASNWLEGGR